MRVFLLLILLYCNFCISQVDNDYKREYCKCINEQINNSISVINKNDFDLLDEARDIERFIFKKSNPNKNDYSNLIEGNNLESKDSLINSLESKGLILITALPIIVKSCPIMSIEKLNESDEVIQELIKSPLVWEREDLDIKVLLDMYIDTINDDQFVSIEYRIPLLFMILFNLHD